MKNFIAGGIQGLVCFAVGVLADQVFGGYSLFIGILVTFIALHFADLLMTSELYD